VEVRPGEVLSHFRILEKIDEGGMGIVFRSRDLHLQRDVALKVLSHRRPITESAEHRFRKEALALSRLNHPNIAAVFDFDVHEGITFLVMEWIEGVSLDVKLQERPLDEDEILDYAEQISEGIAYAHRQGVVHRDLKPGNLRINTDGRIKILDFGLASLKPISDSDLTETLPAPQAVVGTLPYLAPERMSGRVATPVTDVYSIGAVLYEMATGRRAFPQTDSETLTAAILHEPPEAPRRINPRISMALEHLILKTLEKRPERRYQSAEELRADLTRIRKGLPLVVSRPWLLRRPALLPVSAAAALAAGLLMFGVLPKRVAPQVAVMKPLATSAADEWSPQISHDKQWVSYVSSRGGRGTIWLQRLKGGAPIAIASEAGIISSVWSPDGEALAFLVVDLENIFLRIIPAFGGGPATTTRLLPEYRNASLIRWLRNGIYIDVRKGGLDRFDPVTGRTTRLVTSLGPKGLRTNFDVRPDEQQIVYSIRNERDRLTLWLAETDGEGAEQLTAGTSNDSEARYGGRSGEYLFLTSDRSGQVDIWKMRLRDRQLQQVTFSPTVEFVSDVANDLSLLTFVELREGSHLWWLEPRTGQHRQVTADALRDAWPTLSRSGSRLILQREKPKIDWSKGLYNAELFMSSLETAQSPASWTPIGDGGGARLSPDGKRVAFVRPIGPNFELRVRDLDGLREWRVTDRFKTSRTYPFPRDSNRINAAWTADGSALLFLHTSIAGEEQIAVAHDDGNTQTLYRAPKGTAIGDLQPSPDDRHFAFVTAPAGEAGTSAVHVMDPSSGADKVILSMRHDWRANMFVRGWLSAHEVVVLQAFFNPDWSERATVLTVDTNGAMRNIGEIRRGYIGTARLDPAARLLYLTGVDDGDIHNLIAFSLDDATVRTITNNTVSGVSFASIEIDAKGDVLYLRQENNQDVWTIELSPG